MDAKEGVCNREGRFRRRRGGVEAFLPKGLNKRNRNLKKAIITPLATHMTPLFKSYKHTH